ncbi:MAG TPA: pyrroline-5-carboxylate reductase dimerization domain-containing protein [Myxococcota bacterium]
MLGLGGLGGAIARGLAAAGSDIELAVCDRHPEKRAGFVRAFADASEAVAGADAVVLAVKPKHIAGLAHAIEPNVGADALLISCAAGIAAQAIGRPGRAVARVMPSIGAAVGASVTAAFYGEHCVPERDRPRLLLVFGRLGEVREVPDENWLHAAAALTASAPAWLLLCVEALVDGGVEAGLPRADALAFARGALAAGAARLVDGVEPVSLRGAVTSPGGTTAAGIAALESRGVRAGFLDAVRAAVARSRALGS